LISFRRAALRLPSPDRQGRKAIAPFCRVFAVVVVVRSTRAAMSFLGTVTGLLESLTPASTSASLVHTGCLTPDEFLSACDALVAASPLWAWARADAPRSYLPLSKQFLVANLCGVRAARPPPDEDCSGDECDGAPLGAPAVTDVAAVTPDAPAAPPASFRASIVYDARFCTPRLFLLASTPSGGALDPRAVLADVVCETMASTTATLERHPLRPSLPLHVALHPCKHAAVMRALLHDVAKDERVARYATLWLKSLASALPGVAIDYTGPA
jgi:hypothetical protein